MAANKPSWPNCGCASRCEKRKCSRAGGRELATSGDGAKGVEYSIAAGLAGRAGAIVKMKRILEAAAVSPVITVICARAGVSRTLIKYWLALSRKGRKGDLFDIEIDEGRTERFHKLFEDAREQAWDVIEQTAYNFATGMEREILNYQGRVTYKSDPELIGLGLKGEDAYLRDANGDPVPESVPIKDPEMVRWLLARRRPAEYGNKMQVEHEHKGGVLVVGVTKTSKELEAEYGNKTHDDAMDVEFEEVKPQ